MGKKVVRSFLINGIRVMKEIEIGSEAKVEETKVEAPVEDKPVAKKKKAKKKAKKVVKKVVEAEPEL